MRKLAIFSFSFAVSTILYVTLMGKNAFSVSLYVGLVCVAAISSIVLCFFRMDSAKRVRIVAFGLCAGFLWCWVYERTRIQPLEDTADSGILHARLLEAPQATQYGCRVLCESGSERVLLYLDKEGMELGLGDELAVPVRLSNVSQGETLYYAAKDISFLAFQEGELTRKGNSLSWKDYPALVYAKMQEQIAKIFPADEAPFARALLSGDTDELEYSLRNAMSLTGISHIVAVSGMHVSLICTLVMALCLQRRRLAAGVCMVAMWFFAAMLGFSPSVTRAVIMNTVLLLAPLFHRETDEPTSLGFALLVLLLWNPYSIASVSLQLSFAALAGILIVTRPMIAWLDRVSDRKHWKHDHPWRARLFSACFLSLSTTVGANLLTMPLVAYYFGSISLTSLFVNLFAMPILSYTFAFGYIALIVSVFWLPVGQAVAWVLAWGIRWVCGLVDWVAEFSFCALYTESTFAVAWLGLVYALVPLFYWKRLRKRIVLAAMLVSLFAVFACQYVFRPSFQMTVLDVGQGQCIVVQSGNLTAVVDCGGSDGLEVGEQAARTLLSKSRWSVDALILTHYDSDHTNGVLQLMERMKIHGLFLPQIETEAACKQEIVAAAWRYGIPIYEVEADTALRFSEGSVGLYTPRKSSSENDGLSVLLSVEECDILITGDLTIGAEEALLDSVALPDLEILVAGHHGAKNATGVRLLQELKPETVLISVGKNSYGHPAPETLERIAAVGAAVYRTDYNGSITVKR